MIGLAGPALPNCFGMTIDVPNDTVSWDGSDTGAQAMTDIIITINTTGCPAPPQGICQVTLNSTKALSTPLGGFPPSGIFRSGTFSGTTMAGAYTLRNVSPSNNCFNTGLADQIVGPLFFNNTPLPGTSATTYSNTSTAVFSAALNKTLQVRP